MGLAQNQIHQRPIPNWVLQELEQLENADTCVTPVTKRRLPASPPANPDEEYEVTGDCDNAPPVKKMRSLSSSVPTSCRKRQSPADVSKISTGSSAKEDPEAQKRGTPGFWISRLDLRNILEGESCGRAASQAKHLLTTDKLDAGGRRRLT